MKKIIAIILNVAVVIVITIAAFMFGKLLFQFLN